MGEHDQTVLHGDDPHQDIHDDGRAFHPLGIDENPDVVAFSDAYNLTPVFRYSGDKLISDAIHAHVRPFHETKWESLYSSLFGTGVKPTRFDDGVEPSFTPIVDESYRVVGHLGWINMSQICILTDARGGAALDLQKAEKGRLAEERQRLLSIHDRDPLPAFPARRARPEPDTKFWADVRAGRDKDGSEEERHQKNFNFFLAAGGTALVGRAIAMELWDSERYEMYWIEGYRCLALVAPDGHLQGVLRVEKIHYESRSERDLRLVLKVVDIALTIWMVIDLVTIPVALIRVGLWVAERVEIRAIKLAVNRAAKAALEAAELEAKRLAEAAAREAAEAAAKAPAKAVAEAAEITEATVRAAMKDAPLKSQQARVSLPTIRKYVQMLREGKIPPAINVDQGIIVEGNHRYIAGRIFGTDPPIKAWAGGRPAWVVPWEEIVIDMAEW